MSGVEGRRFSRNYVDRGPPTSDSARMRLRIAAVFNDFVTTEFDDYVKLKFGIEGPMYTRAHNWEEWFNKLSLVDFLDVITLFAEFQKKHPYGRPGPWVANVRAVLSEENVRYRIDDLGGVHFSVDGEFEHNQVSALSALSAPRYRAASAHFDAAQSALDQVPPRTRDAIRQIFDSVETIFKLMFPAESRLGAAEITKKLKPIIQDRAISAPEKDAAGRIIEAFKEWTNGAHQYRHAAGGQEPDNPPIEFAVLNVSMGASFARWLAEIDADLQKAARAS